MILTHAQTQTRSQVYRCVITHLTDAGTEGPYVRCADLKITQTSTVNGYNGGGDFFFLVK